MDGPKDRGGISLYGAAFPSGGDGHAAARALLGFALTDAWGWRETPAIACGELGKPYFPDHPEHHYNLSHTDGLCLCALSLRGPVGVDIEWVRPRRAGLPERVLSGAELAAFDGTWEDFYRLWTLKEAFCKLRGQSIYPPKSVPAPPPVPCRSYAGDGWRAALCGENGLLPEKIMWVGLFGNAERPLS